MLSISFFLGILWASRRYRKAGQNPAKMIDLAVVIIIAAIVGSRLFYVAFHWDEFAGNVIDIINPFNNPQGIGIAGLSMDGGIILAVLGGLLYLRAAKQPVLRALDAIAPSFALGIFFTRLGCFLNGCCFGLPCTSPWGLVFPQQSLAGWTFPDLHLHPAQLYNSLGGLVMLGLLMILERYQRFTGYLFLLAVIFYGILRLVVDFYRYFEESVILYHFGGLHFTVNQVISLAAIALALVFFIALSRSRTRS
jgi:phosphatidylglycerol:prolipoprotein diacylglycerol transferase